MRPHARKRVLALDLLLVALFFLCGARLANAEIFVVQKNAPLVDIARLAGRIVRGNVQSITTYWGLDGNIHTKATFKVEESIKGPPADTLVFDFRGGKFGNIRETIPGHPDFANHEPSILFLTEVDHLLRPVGGPLAKLAIRQSANGSGEVVTLPESGQPKTVRLESALQVLRNLTHQAGAR